MAASDSKNAKPTKREIAVALSYRPDDGDQAPKVVASGRGLLARAILDRAFESGVKVREDADLAQLLSVVDVDSVIPLEAFMAVSEILAYVYRANQQKVPTVVRRGRGSMTDAPSAPEELPAPDALAAREELAKVSSLALTARRLIAGGKLVDLVALEERVRAVCEAVQAMPRENGQSLIEDMQALINRLDQLSRELESRLAANGGPSAPKAD